METIYCWRINEIATSGTYGALLAMTGVAMDRRKPVLGCRVYGRRPVLYSIADAISPIALLTHSKLWGTLHTRVFSVRPAASRWTPCNDGRGCGQAKACFLLDRYRDLAKFYI